jgi:membrane protein implicated in regulation of membrane protease activity
MFLIVALVLFFTLPWPASVVALLVCLLIFLGELAFWHGRVRGHPKVVGRQRLIGATGIAISACRPSGQIRVNGEIWAARCDDGVDAGESVSVERLDGLTLVVRRAAGRASRAG